MTNEAYVFNETNRERAITKRSASHRKCGSKSKSCRLEVDKMTQKQIAKQHGPVSCWKLTDFYTWADFLKMPNDIKIEYINRLISTYRVGLFAISEILFEKSSQSLYRWFYRNGLLDKLDYRSQAKTRPKQKDLNAFRDAVELSREPTESPTLESSETIEDSTREMIVKAKPEPETFSTSYISDGIDLDIIAFVNEMFSGQKIRVSITVEKL